jgi:flavin prenyltransferase
MKKKKIAVGITGASGAIYARTLLEKLSQLESQVEEVGIVMSNNAKTVWEHELGDKEYMNFKFNFFEKHDFMAPFASGSGGYDAFIACPCSMGTLGRIAHGLSDDLLTRAADVMLKERRRLLLVTRETPLNLIHIENMRLITLAGGIILPASPSFYSGVKTLEEAVITVVDRVLEHCDLDVKGFRWGGSKN